jgi:hypothetical protein
MPASLHGEIMEGSGRRAGPTGLLVPDGEAAEQEAEHRDDDHGETEHRGYTRHASSAAGPMWPPLAWVRVSSPHAPTGRQLVRPIGLKKCDNWSKLKSIPCDTTLQS